MYKTSYICIYLSLFSKINMYICIFSNFGIIAKDIDNSQLFLK